LPTSSFFFVSTEMTGWPAAWAATTAALICRIDMLELGVAIRVNANPHRPCGWPLARSRVRPAALRNAVGADRVAHLNQRGRQLVEAFRYPQQRADRVAERDWLDDTLEIVKQRRITFGERTRAAAFTADLARCKAVAH
jgi:hypothetical protein